MAKSLILKDLLDKQLKETPSKIKLQYNDLKRISKYINTSIFDETECCLWNGYVTNENKKNKGTYINFYFKNKKMALHRLLYINFIENLSDDEYLKFNCENKGRCCSISHMKKFMYQRFYDNKIETENTSTNKAEIIIENKTPDNKISDNKILDNKILLDFD